MKIYNKFKVNFIQKAYTEGIYADTPANRKLGRVGMTYAQYAAKQKGEEEKKEEKSKKELRFTVEEIKKKIVDALNSLKRNNDYVTISTNAGHTIRFQRNFGNSNKFGKALVKDSQDKVIKSFENSSEEALINSVSSYIQRLDVNIVKKESGGEEEVNIEDNSKILTSKMKEAKDKNLGTIVLKGSGDKIIYLNRQRNGRWLKDFEAYTIRDSKRNVLSQGKAESESELLNKLNAYLQKNKIKLI